MQIIFDESPGAGLSNGRLNLNELAGQNSAVFINHIPAFRMGGGDFKKLAKQMPGAKFITSFEPDGGADPDTPHYRLASPNESLSADGIRVHTIPALGGGLGYLVEVDGVRIFDARLHVSSTDAWAMAEYRQEIDFIISEVLYRSEKKHMKKEFTIAILLLIVCPSSAQQFTDLYGDYPEQNPPGNTPVFFTPGIVSTDSLIEHSAPTFSPYDPVYHSFVDLMSYTFYYFSAGGIL